MYNQLGTISLHSPFIALWEALRNTYWDDLHEYHTLWWALAFYVSATIIATAAAHRLEFYKYRLIGVRNAKTALWGCLFFWLACFPCFLVNLLLVVGGKASRRESGADNAVGLYAISSLWSALWFFALAMSLPNHINSTMMSNEAAAVAGLRNYSRAQIVFENGGLAEIGGNSVRNVGYCDNFRNLYYGKNAFGHRLSLILKDMADAWAGHTRGAPTRIDHENDGEAYWGYLYLEDPYVAGNGLWETRFGLLAYPKYPQRTGYHIFWIGTDGDVLYRPGAKGGFSLLTEEQSPLHPAGKNEWHEL